MNTAAYSLTIIIPVYNEENRIDTSFREVLNFNKAELFKKFEILFVNDGSTDKTASKITDFINNNKNINCSLISYKPNRGKGFAIKTGVFAAKMDYILMADADMSTPLTEVAKFIPGISSGDEFIIGSRKLNTSDLSKQQGWLRRQIGLIYVLFSRLISGLKNISDFGCGFKIFKTDIARKIFPQIKISGWVFDVEMLYLFNRAGVNIEQVGVRWHNDENSKLNFIRDLPKIVTDMTKLRLIHSNVYKNLSKNVPSQLRWYHFLVMFLVSFLLITWRRPDIFLYPQFWAEDGAYWFKDAYNGQILVSLITPMAGYLQTISRLAGAIASIFPLKAAPLVFNLLALSIKILPILFIFSDRFKKILPNQWAKIALALIYIALPNTGEIFVNITNAQWYLGLLAILIFISEPSQKMLWKFFDGFFIALSCLSGPFCIFLIPAVILRYIWSSPLDRKQLRSIYLIFGVFTALQLYTMFMGDVLVSRQNQETRYGLDVLIKLITGQIYIGSLIGQRGYAFYLNHLSSWNSIIKNMVYYAIFIGGTGVIGYAFWRGQKELRIFIVFCLTTFIFALIRPMVLATESLSQWQIMSQPGSATRYYFLPMLAFLVSSVALFYKKNPWIIKLLGFFIFFIFTFGLIFEFFYAPWHNYHYIDQVDEFQNQSIDTSMDIQIVPYEYKMRLYRK